MKLPAGYQPPCFSKQWHRVALFVFVLSWSVMLVPLLIWPESIASRMFCFACLAVGGASVLPLLVFGIFRNQQPCADDMAE